jgi:heme exporter protein B
VDGLILAPADKAAIYLGKLAGTTALMVAMEVIFVVATGIFYNLDIWAAVPRLLLVAVAGTIGFAAVGTLFAAMTAHLRAREVLLPVLLLPLAVPVLLAAVKLSELALAGEGGPGVAVVAAPARLRRVFVVAGLLTFEFVLRRERAPSAGRPRVALLAVGLWLGLGVAPDAMEQRAADHVRPRPRIRPGTSRSGLSCSRASPS